MTEQETPTTGNLLRKTYDVATQRLREQYPEDFIKLRQEAADELGVDWTPRLTAEQRAERDLDELLDEFPHLRERVLNTPE